MTAPAAPRVGTKLGPYELVSFLGAGGMGEVYRARDGRLSREVAVKVLPGIFASDPDRLRRFEQEARAAGSLNHPNVLTVHDVGVEAGTPYVVSELLEGETLRSRLEQGPPPVHKAVEVAREICEGLAAAHDKGIVHRDLKPENVFLTRLGHAKILDFGLAKLRMAPAGHEDTGVLSAASTVEQTRAGVVLGTVGYMSPEQIRGEPVDPRSDVFALGTVLHEILSGSRPFRGPTSADTMHAILHEDPPAIEGKAGPGLARVVRRCLEKRPEERFQSARDVAFALEAVSGSTDLAPRPFPRWPGLKGRVLAATLVVVVVTALLAFERRSRSRSGASGQGGPAPVRSVAVLPFQPRGVVAGQDHLGLALPDEIATVLTYAPGLAVRSFTDSSRYAGQGLDLTRAGRELGVQHLVVGSFGREGEELRFSVEAVELTSNRVLWRDTWTVAVTQLKSLRDTVRERVSAGLLPALGQPGALLAGARRGPKSDESYDLYLRASSLSMDAAPNQEALRLLDRATALDPDFAPAWFELARRLSWDGTIYDGGETSRQRSDQAIARATRLDPDLLPAIVFKIARVVETNPGRVAEAYRAAEALVGRRPESAQAHFIRSYTLRYGGAIAESARECRQARALDPKDPGLWSCYFVFLYLRDYEQAESFLNLARERLPELHASALADIWMRKGDRERARQSIVATSDQMAGMDLQRACLQEPRPAVTAALVKRDLAKLDLYGNDSEGRYWLAALVADCGFAEPAFRFLARSIDDGYCSFVALDSDPFWDHLRQDPEFRRLRERALQCHERFRTEVGLGWP